MPKRVLEATIDIPRIPEDSQRAPRASDTPELVSGRSNVAVRIGRL
jgi:hypothetical protein